MYIVLSLVVKIVLTWLAFFDIMQLNKNNS